MKKSASACLAVCLHIAISAVTAWGQVRTVVVPVIAENAAGTGGNSIPLGNSASGVFQILYDPSLLMMPTGSTITGMQFRMNNTATSNFPSTNTNVFPYTVRMASSTKTPATMSSTFAANMENPVVVVNGLALPANAYTSGASGGTPEAWGPVIPLTTPYKYQGGVLAMEFRTSTFNTIGSHFADMWSMPGSVSVALGASINDTTAALVYSTLGLVVKFTFTLPVPGTEAGQSLQTVPVANESVAGIRSSSIPLGIPAGGQPGGRHQTLYRADQLAGIPVGSILAGVQFRLRSAAPYSWPLFGGTIPDYEIWLGQSPNTPATMSTVFAENMPDAQKVHDGPLVLAANAFPGYLNGSTPEDWGPVITFQSGFRYLGGALALEVRVSDGPFTFEYVDCALNSLAAAGIGSEMSATHPTGDDAGAMIARLIFTPPAELTRGVTKVFAPKVAAVFAFQTSSNELLSYWDSMTHQSILAGNQLEEVAPGSDFIGMSWRAGMGYVGTWPMQPEQVSYYDIQMSQSQNEPNAMASSIPLNVGIDALMVQTGPLIFQPGTLGDIQTFGAEVPFDQPYPYRGGPLLTVTRHNPLSFSPSLLLESINPGNSRYGTQVKALYRTSTFGDSTLSQGGYVVTRYSVEAATMSPLDQRAPTSGNAGVALSPLFQTVLSASELQYIPVGSVIEALWLRQIVTAAAGPASTVTATDFEVTLSSATAQPESMSTTASANEGADAVLVYDGPLTVEAGTIPAGSSGNHGKIAQFQRNFVYKGGPLCITVRHTGLSGPLGLPEAVKGTTLTNRTIQGAIVGANEGLFLPADSTGTALKLGFIPSVMVPNNLATSPGPVGSSMPQQSAGVVQMVISAQQLAVMNVGDAITGLSFRHSDFSDNRLFPAARTNLTRFEVSLASATRSPSNVSTTFADNGEDRNNSHAGSPGLVRRGQLTVPANAYPAAGVTGVASENNWYVPLTDHYIHTGSDLCVTIRWQGVLSPTGRFDGAGISPTPQAAMVWSFGNADATTGSISGPIAIRFAFTPRFFCRCDLNRDGIVADEDFVVFASAYDTLDCTSGAMQAGCPADFNFDRMVDDMDFVEFAEAYDELTCE